MSETPFAKIVRGELPCLAVWECPWTLGFLDIQPLSPGHTLLVPKRAAATLDALDEESAAALGRALPPLCRAIVAATGCPGYNILQNNGAAAQQAVMHVHFHIIPKPSPAAGLTFSWQPRALSEDRGRLLAADIVAQVAQMRAGAVPAPERSDPS